MTRVFACALVVLGGAGVARGEPLTPQASWEGGIDYFVTGAPLAVDGPDTDTTMVDTFAEPASVDVTATDVPATATLLAAYVYWAGTVDDHLDCSTAPAPPPTIDDTITFTPPAAVGMSLVADVCYCAAGAGSYDIQACRADVTALVDASGMIGTYTVDGFAARIGNGSTDNASFALVLVYEEVDLLLPRRVALYDGVEEFYATTRTISLTGIDVDDPAVGDLTWYALDGDVGGGAESVVVTGQPGGASATLSDAINPPDNPMNRTINTTTPVQTGTNGVDIDRLDISAALASTDTAADMTYSSALDKYWVVFNIVGINVFKPVIDPKSTKTWTVQVDADGSGGPSAGDTIRYSINVENTGTAPASVDIYDPIPTAAESWTMVDTGGGVDVSTATDLQVNDVPIPQGTTVSVVFDMVLSAASAGTTVTNVAAYDARPDSSFGPIVAAPIYVASGVVDAGAADGAGAAADAAGGAADAAGGDASSADAGPTGGRPDAAAADGGAGADARIADAAGGGGVDGAGGLPGQASGCDCRTAARRGAGGAAGGGAAGGGAACLMGLLLVGAAIRRWSWRAPGAPSTARRRAAPLTGVPGAAAATRRTPPSA